MAEPKAAALVALPRVLAERVLQGARDREKRVMSGAGLPHDDLVLFLRLVKELAVDVIRADEDKQARPSEVRETAQATPDGETT